MLGPQCDCLESDSVLHGTVLITNFNVSVKLHLIETPVPLYCFIMVLQTTYLVLLWIMLLFMALKFCIN